MAKKTDVLELANEEDLLECFLFLPKHFKSNEEENLNSTLEKANNLIKKLSENYLWHRNEFKLTTRSTDALLNNDKNFESLPPHLYGVLRYGDNIEDEWFVVYILTCLTKEIDELIVRVCDSDGEFLLIEAADFLPKWANPDSCDNRVYIYKGAVHIVPPKDEECEINIQTALNEIHTNPSLTMASTEIQNCIMNKIKGYPEKIQENLHRTTLYLPIGVATILKYKPNLIAPAVQAFCDRDPTDLKICRAMKHFPPEVRVRSRVTFTKYLYAMLTHSKYQPDRKTGWNLPPINSPQYKAHSLGVKVACGFEILISQAKPNDIESDKAWKMYLKGLQEKGYFKDLLESSKEYNSLMNRAKDFYLNHRDSMHRTPTIGQEILNLTKTLETGENAESDLPDDDDSWLNVTPDVLDKLLQDQYGNKKTVLLNSDTDPSDFTGKITSFLNHVSDVEGAEFPETSEVPVRPPRRKQKVTFSGDKSENDTNKINFDPSSFSCAVQNILNFMIPDDESWDFNSDSDMSDYENEDVNPCRKMQQIMDEMDKELAGTTIGESFKTKEDGFEDIETFKPVDIDVNTLKNVLESYRSQLGEAGPSSNMLGPMGIHLDNRNGASD